DAAPLEDADHAAPRALVRLPRHHADADVSSGVSAAEPRRQASRVGGHPEGDARPRAADRGEVMRRAPRAAAVMLVVAPGAPARAAVVARMVVDGMINAAVADYVAESISRVKSEDAAALVIELDTPGGMLTSARKIVKDMLAAPLPIVVYVAPSGAGAGSAG